MKGKITELKQNEKNFFFKVEGDSRSFSGYGQSEFRQGDLVEFDVVVNGQYNNAKDIELALPHEVEQERRNIDSEMISSAASRAVELEVAVKKLCTLNQIEGMDKSQTLVTARLLLGLGA